MSTILNKKVLLSAIIFAVLFVPNAMAQTAPAGFQVESVVGGLNLPVGLEFASNGDIFIAEKGGTIRLVDTGVLIETPVHTLTDINDYGDRGLVGFVLDPNFEENGYMYLSYTYENTPGEDFEAAKTGRVVRITYDPITQLSVPGSELILLGTTGGDSVRPSCTDFAVGTDCIAADGSSHTSDDLVFGPDGMLYVSIGDAADFDTEDPLAHRAQDIESLNGKILRINPLNGEGLTDNPFYTSNVNRNEAKVWSMGLRNPFRMSFRTSTDSLYVGDVGWFSWEEVNIADSGSNFGWPCREGSVANPGGYPATGFTCDAASAYDEPLHSYEHDVTTGAGSVTGGVFYTDTTYPAEYQDAYFYGDFAQNWINYMVLDASDNLISDNTFISDAGGPVEFAVDNDGNINYISIYTGEVLKIVYTGGNVAPSASISAVPTSGLAPLPVFFSSNGSSDPDGDPITFSWDFGDGSPVSSDSNPSHTYTTDGSYEVTLTVSDDSGATDVESITVTVGNTAPTAIIAAPSDGDLYTALSYVSLLGVATDPEDGVINDDASFSWEILLHHNVHYHVLQSLSGQNPDLLPPFHGNDDIHLEIVLTVTDSEGLTGTDSILMYLDETGTPAPFHVNSIVSPTGPITGEPLTITTTVDNTGDAEPILVDIELFDSSGAQVAQSFYDSQTITAGEPQDFTLDFTPNTDDTYRVAVGLIHEGWQGLYEWTNDALSFVVGTGGGGNTAPSITLSGDNPLNLNTGDTFTEPGFTANDAEDGDITGSVIVGGDTVDTGTVGTYTITYDVTDAGGLAAPQQTRSVVVTNEGSWTPIAPNGAIFFDGVDDYIDTEFWDIEEPIGFTLEARFAADTFNGDTPFIGKTDGATGTPSVDWMFGLREVSPTEATLVYTITSGGTTETLTGGSVPLGTMVQASAVYDNTDMILYINGVEVARTSKTGLIAQDITHAVWLGNLPEDPTTNVFHGVFDEIRVWNEPQTAAEILEFQGELTQKELGLIKDWRFNEGFGQVVIDRSNSGHHGHLGSVHGAVDDNDPSFLAGVYPAGGAFSPVHNGTIATPNPVEPNLPTTLTTTIENTGDGAGFMIVNIEIFDSADVQVFQTFVDGEGFFPGEIRDFEFEWTPTDDGEYRVSVGLVHLFWADVYAWIDDTGTITVTTGGGNQVPTITILGDNPLNLNVGDAYTDDGATATDTEDGDLTSSIIVGGDTVDTETVGTYVVTYDVTDSGGLPAIQATRDVVVSEVGNEAPSITLIGDNPLNLSLDDIFTDPGYTATDPEEGDLTGIVVVGGDTVDTAIAGTYTITYDVTDSLGQGAPQVTRDVIVSDPSAIFTLAYASAVATPDPSTTGEDVTITASVTNTGEAGNGVINLELYAGGVQVHQEIFESQAFGAGETRDFEFTYTSASEGVYSLQVGLYEEFWAGFFSWTADAVVFTVEDGGAGGGTTIIYDDTFALGFANWGWDATFDLSSTAVTASEGINSIETSFTQPWGGLYIHHDAFDTTGDTNLVFDIHGGTTGGQLLQVGALDDTSTLTGQVLIDAYETVLVDDWVTVTIPLADISAVDQTITGLIIQGSSGAIEPTFYLDNILTE